MRNGYRIINARCEAPNRKTFVQKAIEYRQAGSRSPSLAYGTCGGSRMAAR